MKHLKTQDRILQLIKTQGEKTASELGRDLNITSMGARQHLERMESEGLLISKDVKQGVGRPKRFWSLSEKSLQHFPDRHDQLTLDMLISIKNVFGDQGLEQLINHRSQTTKNLYRIELDKIISLEDKVSTLTRIRSEEGYMAGYSSVDNDFLFYENHCPICFAASACQNFCRSELEIFQSLFEGLATITRQEHILEGSRRCSYLISPLLK